jgi:hypothetical protein
VLLDVLVDVIVLVTDGDVEEDTDPDDEDEPDGDGVTLLELVGLVDPLGLLVTDDEPVDELLGVAEIE